MSTENSARGQLGCCRLTFPQAGSLPQLLAHLDQNQRQQHPEILLSP